MSPFFININLIVCYSSFYIFILLLKHVNVLKIHNEKYIMALPHKNDRRCLCGFFWFFQVPVPVFLPTTLQNAEQIVKTISELKAKVSSDPLEADLIAMAEVIAQEEEKPKCSSKNMLGVVSLWQDSTCVCNITAVGSHFAALWHSLVSILHFYTHKPVIPLHSNCTILKW